MVRGKKLKADVAVSALFAVLRAIVLLWLIRIAGEAYPPALLGVFLLSRRVAATGSNFFQFGASQTIRRYISSNINQNAIKLAYLTVALVGWVVLAAVSLPIVFYFRSALSEWLYPGTNDAASLAFWTCANALALILGYIVASSMIAERKIAIGNSLDTLAVGGLLIPPLLLFGGTVSPAELLRFHTGALIISCFAVALWYYLLLRDNRRLDRSMLRDAVDNFCGYGFPRTFVTFGEMLILLIGPWLLRYNAEEAGYLLIAMTLTRTIQAVIQPLTQIASVVTARLANNQDEAMLGEGVKLLFGTILYSSTLLIAVLLPWRDTLLSWWLGTSEVIEGVRYYFDTLMWAIIPFAVFQGLKGVVEMRWFRPLNLYTLASSCAVYFVSFAILARFGEPRQAARDSTLIAFVVLGICTSVWCRSYVRPVSYWGIYQLLTASAVLMLLNTWLAINSGIWQFVLAVIASAVVVFSLTLLRPAPYIQALQMFLLPRHQTR